MSAVAWSEQLYNTIKRSTQSAMATYLTCMERLWRLQCVPVRMLVLNTDAVTSTMLHRSQRHAQQLTDSGDMCMSFSWERKLLSIRIHFCGFFTELPGNP